jgi:Xaa-Pro aminopeptidase
MSAPQTLPEDQRIAALIDAQGKAAALFERIAQSLIRPGIGEMQLTHEIAELGRREFGIEQNWHKRIVRAGPNTLEPYNENPPDLMIGEDDILFVDLGPVFEAWEADFGRTFVLGSDPHKLRLRDDLALAFASVKRYFQERPDITGSQLYRYTQELAAQGGWEFGGTIAGHLIGEFPHKSVPIERAHSIVDADNHTVMRGLDALGRQRHWILEIHFVDRARRIGGFYEELLTIG